MRAETYAYLRLLYAVPCHAGYWCAPQNLQKRKPRGADLFIVILLLVLNPSNKVIHHTSLLGDARMTPSTARSLQGCQLPGMFHFPDEHRVPNPVRTRWGYLPLGPRDLSLASRGVKAVR